LKHSSKKHEYHSFSNPVKVIEHNWNDNTIPMVSVHCVTYNHELYIRDALEGFLMQKTTFPIQICILDDASTDDNVKIIKEYANKYLNLFKCFFLEENTWGKSNRMEMAKPFLDACNEGKYIAMCDGDDYWTDSLKLQKQVDFLEENPEFSFCFHQVNGVNENGKLINITETSGEISRYSQEKIFEIKVPMPSIVIRNNILSFPEEFNNVPHGDPFLYAMLATKGNFADLGFIGANRRIHPGGVYCGQPLAKRFLNTIKTRRIMLSADCFSPHIKQLIKNQLRRKKRKYLWKLMKKLKVSSFFKILFA